MAGFEAECRARFSTVYGTKVFYLEWPDDFNPKQTSNSKHPRNKQIYQSFLAGESATSISKRFGVTSARISQICYLTNRRIYKHLHGRYPSNRELRREND